MRLDALEAVNNSVALEVMLMHRALYRCQARCHVRAEPPKGWRAVWAALRGLVRKKEPEEREEQTTKSLAIMEVLPLEPSDKIEGEKSGE
jgi:hypothetical protein